MVVTNNILVIKDNHYDTDYSLLTVKSIQGLETFSNIKSLLDSSIATLETLALYITILIFLADIQRNTPKRPQSLIEKSDLTQKNIDVPFTPREFWYLYKLWRSWKDKFQILYI